MTGSRSCPRFRAVSRASPRGWRPKVARDIRRLVASRRFCCRPRSSARCSSRSSRRRRASRSGGAAARLSAYALVLDRAHGGREPLPTLGASTPGHDASVGRPLERATPRRPAVDHDPAAPRVLRRRRGSRSRRGVDHDEGAAEDPLVLEMPASALSAPGIAHPTSGSAPGICLDLTVRARFEARCSPQHHEQCLLKDVLTFPAPSGSPARFEMQRVQQLRQTLEQTRRVRVTLLVEQVLRGTTPNSFKRVRADLDARRARGGSRLIGIAL